MSTALEHDSASTSLCARPAAANDSLYSLGLNCMLRLWSVRRFLLKAALVGGALGLAIALLLPKEYASTTRLMPPDRQSPSGAAALAAMLGDRAATLGGDALGLRTPGAVFVQVLGSRTVEDHLIDRFALRKLYRVSLYHRDSAVVPLYVVLTTYGEFNVLAQRAPGLTGMQNRKVIG